MGLSGGVHDPVKRVCSTCESLLKVQVVCIWYCQRTEWCCTPILKERMQTVAALKSQAFAAINSWIRNKMPSFYIGILGFFRIPISTLICRAPARSPLMDRAMRRWYPRKVVRHRCVIAIPNGTSEWDDSLWKMRSTCCLRFLLHHNSSDAELWMNESSNTKINNRQNHWITTIAKTSLHFRPCCVEHWRANHTWPLYGCPRTTCQTNVGRMFNECCPCPVPFNWTEFPLRYDSSRCVHFISWFRTW